MKRLLLLLVLILCTVALYAQSNLVKTYDFKVPVISETRSGDSTVRMEGTMDYGVPGCPVLPAYTAKLVLPQGASVASVTVNPIDTVLLAKGVCVSSHPGHSITLDAQPVPRNAAVYSSVEPYPATCYAEAGSGNLKGYGIALVNLYPVQYVPATGELFYHSKMEVRISLTADVRGTDCFLRGTQDDLDDVMSIVDNPEIATLSRAKTPTRDNTHQYLIITNSAMMSAFNALATHKQSKGYQTQVVDIATAIAGQTGVDNAEKLRNYIKWAYQNHGTQYVVLGGDSGIVYYRGCYGFIQSSSGPITDTAIPTDFYFSDLTGNWNSNGNTYWGEPADDVDFFAEVSVGRISAESATEATNQINKIIAYENSTNRPYTDFLAGEELDASTLGGDSMDVLHQSMVESVPDKLYDTHSVKWTASQIIAKFNSNAINICNHLGHANETTCFKMSASQAAALTNTTPFFAYSEGCLPGAFNTGCFAEAMTTGNSKGAFAVIMNSRYGLYSSGSTNGVSTLFHTPFARAVYEQNVRSLGTAVARSKEAMAGVASRDSAFRWIFYVINLFGCPETKLKWTCTATKAKAAAIYPTANFILPTGDPSLVTVKAYTNCATPLTNPTVQAVLSGNGNNNTVPLADNGVAPDVVAGDNIYSGTVSPTGVGAVTLTISASGAGVTAASQILNGEVVPKVNYTKTTATYAWEDVTSGSAIMDKQDDAGTEVNIGFNFTFYGKTYSKVMMSTNGILRFTSTYTYDSGNIAPIPTQGDPDGIIAALWCDLAVDSANTTGKFYYKTIGTAPNRKFVAEWYKVPHYDKIGDATFEIILEEGTNAIILQYQDTDFGNASYNQGADAVSGIEDYNGLNGIQHSYKQAILANTTAIKFSPASGPSLDFDLNDDGLVNFADVTLLSNVLAGLEISSQADVDQDGVVNATDLTLELAKVAGLF